MREFVVDISESTSFSGFVAAFNQGFCQLVGGHWSGRSWEAFNDYLSWPEEDSYILKIKGWKGCGGLSDAERRSLHEIFHDNSHVTVQFA